jgi:thioredoxin 1
MINLSEENFKEFISSEEKVIVDFFAEWCGPCKAMMPMLENASEQAPTKIGKLNVDQASEIAALYGIRSIPTILIFQDGQMIEKRVGAPKNTEEILEMLN